VRALVLALSVAALGLGGCATLEQKAEHAIAWVRDALQTQLDVPLERATRASVEAMRDMKFTEVTVKSDVLTGIVTAKTAKDEKVTVELTSISEGQTVVDIRVGLITDKAVALKILERIKKNL